jgi:CHAT domain-containing protein
VDETLADVESARAIFLECNEQEKLMRLEINVAYVYTLLGDQHQALQLFYSALTIAEALGIVGELHLGMLYMNIGYVHESLGNFPKALFYYEKARSQYLAHGETSKIIFIENNIACIAQAQGHYRSALRMLNDILGRGSKQFPREHERVKHSLAECYLYLNRYSEARDLTRKVLAGYRSFGDNYSIARALLHLATTEAELGNFTAAQAELDEAAMIFNSLGSVTWCMIARLWHGQIAFKQGNHELAWQEAQAAADCFNMLGQQVNYATACILIGQIAFARGDLDFAQQHGIHSLQVAQHYKIPYLRYQAYLLLGHVARASSLFMRAIRCFRAAAATIERVQRGLTITLRSGFLEDKGEAWRGLIGLYLHLEQADFAFEALEQAKSQVLVNYLNNREQFHWSREEPESRALIEELEHLRAEHQSFDHLRFNPPREQDALNSTLPEVPQSEVVVRERRMRAITEKLYLLSYSDNTATSSFSSLIPATQASIDERTLLLEFYDDGVKLWAFVLDGQSCKVRALPVKVEALKQVLNQLKSNLTAALRLEQGSPASVRLTISAQRLLHHLYEVLLEPLEIQTYGKERIYIVPYGILHYLPFHLLYDGANYLIENYEVVILPAASLLARSSPCRSPGALIISHSWGGNLPNTLAEAQIVQGLFDGVLHAEEAATRSVLQAQPSQILHIATHGQHRPDQPDLSFLELADGQLYTDDLLQQDLSYELVTLSACETGRANVAADEELIGIGRGLLYAGAGALILSLWQVADTTTTLTLMEHLYRALHRGDSKAAALREAQLFILQQDRQLHPALWGAFQLIGDAKPLSKVN